MEEVGGSAPDGSVNLVLHRQGGRVVVQCKRWRSTQVGVTLIREFFGVTVAEKAERGIFVATGTFTPDAVATSAGRSIVSERQQQPVRCLTTVGLTRCIS